MDILLHVGMPKAGSTAIQRRLAGLRGWLAAQGLYYPEGLHTPHNHSFLVAAASRRRLLPRHYRRHYGQNTDRAAEIAGAWFETVLADARAARARNLVLSAETLFDALAREDDGGLPALLRRAGGRLTVVAYLRRPSDFYVALAQQKLKADHMLPPPRPASYRAALETWSAVSDELRVRRYDRADFPDGDIARAFLAETGANEADLPPLPAAEANASLSAEGMALLQDYRETFHAGARGRHKKDSRMLARAIAAAEADPDWPRDDPAAPRPSRPRLHRALSEYLDLGAIDLPWLRTRFGIVFPGIDYARIAERSPWPQPTRVADICPIDPGTAHRLGLATMRALARHSMTSRAQRAGSEVTP